MNAPSLPQNDSESFAKCRARMVQNQLVARGISDQRVLAAMKRVPREAFVPAKLVGEAYDDWPLPIGCSQTISQPYTVAYMCEALRLEGSERVLEVGTGSGYAAAVLSLLATEIHTIERIPSLARQAGERLARLGYENIHVHTANGTLGLPNQAPFDAIVVTAGASRLPEPYAQQLAEDGRIVIPIGSDVQTLCRFTRRGGELNREDLGTFVFVPLIGEHSWHER